MEQQADAQKDQIRPALQGIVPDAAGQLQLVARWSGRLCVRPPQPVRSVRAFPGGTGCLRRSDSATLRFLELFEGLDIPRVLYRGKFKGQLLEEIYQGEYRVPEGVVVKGGAGQTLWMAKVKTRAYQERLCSKFGSDWQDYWE